MKTPKNYVLTLGSVAFCKITLFTLAGTKAFYAIANTFSQV